MSNNELPGMWENADLTGGETDNTVHDPRCPARGLWRSTGGCAYCQVAREARAEGIAEGVKAARDAVKAVQPWTADAYLIWRDDVFAAIDGLVKP